MCTFTYTFVHTNKNTAFQEDLFLYFFLVAHTIVVYLNADVNNTNMDMKL
jgi:hypothetical protein